ncbi:hypothetical protein [Wukongibacter sp. M2B1]|uniref:hypothetical protein n=1 Tax=Wukongibacter sp. M2B1 TaxID=3088895 RepID=UPI003D79D199
MEDKKCNLEKDIQEFIGTVINKAEEERKLDFFSIKISNHRGTLQLDYTLGERRKSY